MIETTIAQAINAKNTQMLVNIICLASDGLRVLNQPAVEAPKVDEPVDPVLQKQVRDMATRFVNRDKENGRSNLKNVIVVGALGVAKTFPDFTNEDLKKIRAKLELHESEAKILNLQEL
ncbi:hypothetical protein [Candidatus Liberibacter sp.]|uniref:hypothetical protein n=1 Tax=Candidatus Liberibacter sp. TaxID=34022 RepID=UPI0015F6F3C8|nr:hypothetical protein [Candidatus Liberibacter sp.]MBA5724646.1 hypothetical protein [Candidatus Liberibacter sp.]